MRAAQIFESLPFPSRIESYEFFSREPAKGQKDPWRMTMRLRVLIPAEKST